MRNIKYFVKQYWRYIAMALAYMTISFFINACEVKAETQILSPANLTLVNYYGSTTTTISNPNCHNNVCWWNPGLNTTSYRWKVQSTLQYSSINIITFNIEIQDTIRYDNQFPITNVAFGDYSCYYFLNNQSIYSTGGDYIEQYQISAYCPVQGTINLSSGSVTANLTFDNSGSYAFDKVSLSNITFSKDDKLVEIVNNLGALTTALNNINSNINTTNSNLTWILQSANNSAYWNEVNSGKLQNIYDALSSQTTQIITAQQATTNAVGETNNTLKDSNTNESQGQATNFFNNFDGGSTGSLMDIVSLPLNFLNSLNNSCSAISITIPYFNQTFSLPCLRQSLTQSFGTLINLIVLVINAILCYRLIKGFIDVVHNLKDPNNDDIEVMDL